MKSIAIIGTGIAGMACGHLLHAKHDITLYEQNDYAGGHTNTVTVEEEGHAVPIDTGFMVYNEVTYPELTRLFTRLGVQTKPAPMSFSVQHVPSGLEFCGSGFKGLFAQRKNLTNIAFWKLLWQINRFNKDAPRMLDDYGYETYTLRDYADEMRFGQDFLDKYLIPMSSAVWSTPPDAMLGFPAVTLMRFFKNHGFLGLDTQHQWRTVTGGSQQYRNKLIEPFKTRVRLKTPVVRVTRRPGAVQVMDVQGDARSYDQVIFACHADEALALLADPTAEEHETLSAFQYQKNTATLHTDPSIMPRTRQAWSSWNYRSEIDSQGQPASSTIYWMNSLQGVSDHVNYFVSINGPGNLAPTHIVKRIEYTHPVFSMAAIAAQKKLPSLNENGVVYFCGSYFRYGFHEDALVSAIDLCKTLEKADRV